jgi:hypothetical protein
MCPFCNVEMNRIGSNATKRDPFDVSSRILFESGSVYVCAGLSPLTFPYALIVTKRHFRSFANSDQGERRDVIKALQILLGSGFFRSGQLTVFEHGDVCPLPNTECLDHFHLHVMDGGLDIISAFLKEKPEAGKVSVSENHPLLLNENYFLIGNYTGGTEMEIFTTPNLSCGRQYFRRMIALEAGLQEWDWRKALNEPMTQRLIDSWAKISVKPKIDNAGIS